MEYSDEWMAEQFIAQITKARRIVDGLVGSEDWDENLPDLRNPLNRDLAIWHVATSIGLQTVRAPMFEEDDAEAGSKLPLTISISGIDADDVHAASKEVEEDMLKIDSAGSDRSRVSDLEEQVVQENQNVDANGDPVPDEMNFSNVSRFKGLKGKQFESRARGGTAGERELVSGFKGLKSHGKLIRDQSIDKDAGALLKSKVVSKNPFKSMEKDSLRASRTPSRSPGRSPRGKSPRGKKIKSVFHDMEQSEGLAPPKSPRRRRSGKGKRKDPTTLGSKEEEVEKKESFSINDEFDEMKKSASAGGTDTP